MFIFSFLSSSILKSFVFTLPPPILISFPRSSIQITYRNWNCPNNQLVTILSHKRKIKSWQSKRHECLQENNYKTLSFFLSFFIFSDKTFRLSLCYFHVWPSLIKLRWQVCCPFNISSNKLPVLFLIETPYKDISMRWDSCTVAETVANIPPTVTRKGKHIQWLILW